MRVSFDFCGGPVMHRSFSEIKLAIMHYKFGHRVKLTWQLVTNFGLQQMQLT
jgi:hypothetical protein